MPVENRCIYTEVRMQLGSKKVPIKFYQKAVDFFISKKINNAEYR